MTSFQNYKMAASAFAVLLTTSIAFAIPITRAEYAAAKSSISADYKVDKAACATSSGNAKDICQQQAKGKYKIALAELEFKRSNTFKNESKISVAKADSVYAVAKEVCDEKSGESKTLCRTEAKSAHTKALAESKMTKKVGEAKVDANQDIRDADYKVAIEKCASLGGESKTQCIATAKNTFNKN